MLTGEIGNRIVVLINEPEGQPKSNPLRWTDRKCAGRNIYGPTLQEAYDRWVASGRAAEVDVHKQAYLGYIQALL